MAALARPTPVPARAAAPPRAWWHYVETGRGHEVLAEWRAADQTLRVRESAPGAPDGVHEERARLAEPWEVRVALWTLESRLAMLGAYWRESSNVPGWRRIAMPAGASAPDARPNDVLRHARVGAIHHYHDAHGSGDTLVATMEAKEASRFVLVRAALDVAALELRRVDVVHPRLPASVAASLLLRDQLALAQSGLPKLVSRDDYRRAFGPGGDERVARLVDEMAERVRPGGPERIVVAGRDEQVFAEFLVRLSDPRLLALHRRFLEPAEERELVADGPIAIRRAVAAKRDEVDHRERHLLTILEASLLAHAKMQGGEVRGSDPEVRALTRLAFYL